MRRLSVRASLAVPITVACALLAACGSSSAPGLLSSGQSSALQNRLQKVSQEISNGNCKAAQAGATAFAADVANLPASVNPTLRQNLIQGASTIAQLTPTTCAQNANTGTGTATAQTQTQTTTTTAPPAPTSTSQSTGNTGHTQAAPPPVTHTSTAPANTGPATTTTGSGGVGAGSSGNSGNSGNTSGGAGVGGGG